MKVRYTPRAFSDLEDVRTYIAQYNPTAAGRVIALIESIFDSPYQAHGPQAS